MYDFIKKELYWPYLDNNVQAVVRDFRFPFLRSELCARKEKRQLKLLLFDRPLEGIDMNILLRLPKKK